MDLESWAEENISPANFPVQRNPLKEQSARDRYLARVNHYPQAVSFSDTPRHTRIHWNPFLFFGTKKEFTKMITQLIAALALVATLLGGTGVATVVASQDSLPGELLYPVKIWSEDVQLDLTADADQRIDLSMDFTDRRLEEIQQLLASGITLDESILSMLEGQLDQTLTYLSETPNSEAALDGVLTRFSAQQRLMERAMGHQSDPLQAQIHEMLQTRIQAVEMVKSQIQIQNQNQQQYQTPGAKEPLQQQQNLQGTPDAENPQIQGMNATQMPGENAQQGLNQEKTPKNGGTSQGGQGQLTRTPNAAGSPGSGGGGKP